METKIINSIEEITEFNVSYSFIGTNIVVEIQSNFSNDEYCVCIIKDWRSDWLTGTNRNTVQSWKTFNWAFRAFKKWVEKWYYWLSILNK